VKESCALTLARKFKLGTLAKTFEKFGKDLGYITEKGVRVTFIDIAYTRAANIGKAVSIPLDPLRNIEKVWNKKFTKSKLGASCVICGNKEEVEMHHVKHIKDMRSTNNKLDFYTRQMAAINRKQVPLCRSHHNGLHNDT